MLRKDLCNYSDAYIVLKGTKTVQGNSNTNARKKK